MYMYIFVFIHIYIYIYNPHSRNGYTRGGRGEGNTAGGSPNPPSVILRLGV